MTESNIIDERRVDASPAVAGTTSLSASAPHAQRVRGRRLLAPISLQVLAMLGIAALLYPTAADWFATLSHDSEISGYTEAADRLTDATRTAKLDAARAYNATLPPGVLRDPYTAGSQEAATADPDAYAAYQRVLQIDGTDAIGTLSYSAIGVALPIYAGTDDATLRRGVGHLFGSSLPTGGTSTHSVLTSHSGLINASLFTPLTRAQVGDTFQISVLGETHNYQVSGIETVRPEDTDSLQVVAGQDLVTLVTCTPIGINSHRLLVHATRIADDVAGTAQTIAGDGRTAGFPWWAVIFVAASGAMAWLLFRPVRARIAPAGAATRSTADTDSAQELDA